MMLKHSSLTEKQKKDLRELNGEVVNLLYAQAVAPEKFETETAVSKAVSMLLLNHWHLCSITTFMRDDTGELNDTSLYTDEHIDSMKTKNIVAMLAEQVTLDDGEHEVWLDDASDESEKQASDLMNALAESGMRAGFAVPINADGKLVGTLVVLTIFSDDLREAQPGIRFIAAPILIAVTNARRAAAMREQHNRIEKLIGELSERSRELEEANRELLRIARYRALFLARMTHELRTPLTAMLGFSEILLEMEDLSEKQRRFCQKIQDSGIQQQESLNQLVDLSRLEAGHTELFLHEFSLREVLRESCAAVSRLAIRGGVTLNREVESNLPPLVSDEAKLRQVLYNFLAFAISRTPAGKEVKVYAEQFDHSFRIKITDEGEPITDPQHLFEHIDMPVRGEVPNERGTNMNELGLVIAHRLVDVLKGELKLNNLTPHGLRVTIELPHMPEVEVGG